MNTGIRRIAAAATKGAVAVLVFTGAVDAAVVNNVRLHHVGDFTEVSIPVPARLLCDHFTQPADSTRPFRIILNFCGVEHALPQKNFSHLPACLVREIRTSQYAVDPEPVVRVVLDLAAPATYTVRTDDNALTVAISDPQAGQFAAWEAVVSSPVEMAQKTEVVGKVETAGPPVPTASATNAAPPHRERSFKPEGEVPVAAKASATPTQSAGTVPTAASQSTQERESEKYLISLAGNTQTSSAPPANAGKQPVPASGTPPTQADAGMATPTGGTMPEVVQNMPAVPAAVPAPDASAQVIGGPNPGDMEMAPATLSAPMPGGEGKPFVPPEHPLVLAPEYLDAVAAATATGVVAESRGGVVATMPADSSAQANAVPPPANTTPARASDREEQVWASVEAPEDLAVAEPNAPGTASPTTESLIDRLKVKFFSDRPAPRPYTTTDLTAGGQEGIPPDPTVQGPPTPASPVDREALLERIRLASQGIAAPSPEPTGEVAGSVRAEIHYNDMGRRDPFEPLLKGLRSGFVSEELPSVESLRMVGVLRDEQGAMALLEDMEGHSYIMRTGDAVASGRVLSVGDQRVIFSVDEYGFTRTVALQLSPRGSDPSKSLGATPQVTEPQTVPE